MTSVLRRALSAASSLAQEALRRQDARSARRGSAPGGPPERAKPDAGPRGAAYPGASPGEQHREAASRTTVEYDVTRLGLPDFTYAPEGDDQPDPGEVVWTWVPYDDDPNRGKDRPVLVLGLEGAGLVVAQLSSQDHDRDAADEARWGRYWFDVGTGPWDTKGRPSEVRLDRLLLVDPVAVRREGGALDRAVFDAVVAELRARHG